MVRHFYSQRRAASSRETSNVKLAPIFTKWFLEANSYSRKLISKLFSSQKMDKNLLKSYSNYDLMRQTDILIKKKFSYQKLIKSFEINFDLFVVIFTNIFTHFQVGSLLIGSFTFSLATLTIICYVIMASQIDFKDEFNEVKVLVISVGKNCPRNCLWCRIGSNFESIPTFSNYFIFVKMNLRLRKRCHVMDIFIQLESIC